MPYRPKFDSLYSGPWPYDSSMGVGMRFDGLPNDKEAFIEYLMDFSCHPKAGERIYSRIGCNGFDMVTVMSNLPFNEIANGLKRFGVSMSIIPPLEGAGIPKPEDGPYPESFVPPHLRNTKKKI